MFKTHSNKWAPYRKNKRVKQLLIRDDTACQDISVVKRQALVCSLLLSVCILISRLLNTNNTVD